MPYEKIVNSYNCLSWEDNDCSVWENTLVWGTERDTIPYYFDQ